MQLAKPPDFMRPSRLFENTNGPPVPQPMIACGKAPISVKNSLGGWPDQAPKARPEGQKMSFDPLIFDPNARIALNF